MAKGKGVTRKQKPSAGVRIDPKLLRVISRIAKDGELGPDLSSNTKIANAALQYFLETAAAWEALQEVPNPVICPMCVRSTYVTPIYTEWWPIWLEMGHSISCPVHEERKELALARRKRWEQQYAISGIKEWAREASGQANLESLDELLNIRTQFSEALTERGKQRRLHLEGSRSLLDEGKVTDECRRAYAAVRSHLQKRYKGVKPTEIRAQNGKQAITENGAAFLAAVRALPQPGRATALEIKAVFHEIRQGLLEWAYHEHDGKRPMYEYATTQLGLRGATFSNDEKMRLRTLGWARDFVLLNQP